MSHSVFISYARTVDRAHAIALHEALGGDKGLAFLDLAHVEPGEQFPRVLADALLGAQVVVVFASNAYFRSRFCMWELDAALGPFHALRAEATAEERSEALSPIVLALPEVETSLDLSQLPPVLRAVNWPTAGDTAALERYVRARLAAGPERLGRRLQALGGLAAALRTRLLDAAALPSPKNLARVKVYPRTLLPSLGEAFVGRAEELSRIHHVLSVLQQWRGEGATGAALTGAVQGMGGVGKTRLAVEYLHRYGPDHYRGGLFWIDAAVDPERLEEQFHGILRTLRPEVPDLVTFRREQRNAEHEMAEALDAVAARERVLYVVDNVPEPGADEPPKLLRTWCPVIGRVALLVTSRASVDLESGEVRALPIPMLGVEAAVALLTHKLGQTRLEDAAWRRVVEWVGRLPLALDLLNRALQARVLKPEELLARVDAQDPVEALEQQRRMLRRRVASQSLSGITEAFGVSYGKLSDAEQHLARLLAQFAPAPIPLELLEALGAEVATREACSTLELRHFVTPVAAGDVEMFGVMHRLVMDYLHSVSPQPLTELNHACAALRSLMPPDACLEPRAWPLLNAIIPHALEVFEQLMRMQPAPEQSNALLLGLSIGCFHLARGLAGPARIINEKVVARAMHALGPEASMTLTAQGNLSQSLQEQGDLIGARALAMQVLQTYRRICGAEHPVTLTAMNNLATILLEQGELADARGLHEYVLETRCKVLGEEHPDTQLSVGNLAQTLWRMGDLAGARSFAEQAWEMAARLHGEAHPAALVTMNILAVIRGAQNEKVGARVLEERALELRRRTQGDTHPETLKAMSNLAGTLSALGELERARSLQEEALQGLRCLKGETHPDTLTVMSNLASLARAQGDLARAVLLGEQVLRLQWRLLGEEHPATLAAMNNLARSFYDSGDLARARESWTNSSSRHAAGYKEKLTRTRCVR